MTYQSALETTTNGILLLNKPQGITSFGLVHFLRKITNVKKIGHTGTLDPFATGLMVMLLSRSYTRILPHLVLLDKEYHATIHLGASTTTFDPEGEVTHTSVYQPSLEHVQEVLASFQGEIEQIPPMFSAKRYQGKKLYQLARKGITVERPPQKVHITTRLLNYTYPYLKLHVKCSKGTYIRTLAHDLGNMLGSYAYLENLRRDKVGSFSIDESYSMDYIKTHGITNTMLLTHPYASH